ncbi:hypothetical protein [Enhygromyxa salina]|uniref:Uncharacterized protein n=1 Tax=Enhygromyxa salina TaxID=215803 RepID=A0A2S9Y4D2_9BACT|nr:hypothetical protein [Enhygromyxa salina]PRP99954.1 hypothetical protein ENSA7_61710 [Enhygromyxa salina]
MRTPGDLRVYTLICAASLAASWITACGQASGGAGDGETSSSGMASTTTSTAPTTFTDGPDECGENDLDECEIGDIGEQSCSMIYQNCPTSYKCVPHWPDLASAPEYRCVSVTGAVEPGQTCSIGSLATGNDDCDADGFCWSYNSGLLAGRCHPYCTGGIQYVECIDGWTCSLSDVDPPMCVQRCVPLASDCGVGLECAWTNPDFSCVLEGAGHGVGEPCSLVNDCASELLCVEGLSLTSCAGDECCAAYCTVAAGDGPCQAIDPDYACIPFFEDPPPSGFEDLGVCVLP